MKVLLTGAFGNIGVSALEELVRQGHAVRCFDLKTRANQKEARKWRGRAEVVWGDLRRESDVAAVVRDVEAVIHLAFIIPKMSATGIESEAEPDLAREVNIGGTRNVINALKRLPCPPRLVFASSLHVFGRTQDDEPPRVSTDPVRPVEHYAFHKVACERMIKLSGLQWAILRFGAVLPLDIRLDPGMFDVPLANRIEYVHTRDVGLALANAVSRDDVWGKTLLIGGGPACQFHYRDMLQTILDGIGVGLPPAEAFTSTSFSTDWLDTGESQRLLTYQRLDLNDYVREMTALMGWRRSAIRALRPFIRRWLVNQSPYYREVQRKERTAEWQGKVALVTGASSGIGAVTASRLARQGLTVVLTARRAGRLERLATEIRKQGGEARVIAANLSDERERARVMDETLLACGRLDVLVNNAGLAWYGYASEMPWTLAAEMLQVNVASMVHLSLLALNHMKARGSGHIVNVGSVVGGLPSQGVALYGATKSFMDTFTTALYRELRGTGVRVSVIRPGAVTTEFYDTAAKLSTGLRIPAERLAMKPERVAGRIWSVLNRPRRVSYIPRALQFVPWVELSFGWLIDRLGPLLLRWQMRPARQSVR